MTSLIGELKKLGFSPKRSFGQNFLIDKKVAGEVVRLANVEPEDIVVEIGPGMGALTFHLIPRAKKVVAVELDREMVKYLREKGEGFASLVVVHRDALQFDFRDLAQQEGRKIKVVANLPYNISTPIIFRLLECRDALASATLMLQQEVAQRITSPAGSRDYGPLSIFVQLYTSPKILMRVPPQAFYPPPKVESALVGFEILPRPRVDIADVEFFRAVVRASFAQRRKTILNSLVGSPFCPGSRQQIRGVLEAVGIEPRRRAETLDLEEFKRLAEALGKLGKGTDSVSATKQGVG